MKKICIIGTGYVGLVTGACLADLGHRVACVDNDVNKVSALREGVIPIYEPGLEPLVHKNMGARRLSVTSSLSEAMSGADFVFVCVGTPASEDGRVDLSYVHLAYIDIRSSLNGHRPIIVNKSTVPPGTTNMMATLLARGLNGSPHPKVASNPEFLREGHAVHDFFSPSRVVVGAANPDTASAVADLYKSLDSPILITNTRTAEMIKLASNAFLAMKISFINEMAAICEQIGVDVTEMSGGLGLDPRIGRWYLRAGPGYGGSCLPKDLSLLSQFCRVHGQDATLLNAVMSVNEQQPKRLITQLAEMVGSLRGANIGLLGLAFKADTDDVRHSPALALLREILAAGAHVRAYDPKAIDNARREAPEAEYVDDPYRCADGCDALVIGTEWPEFGQLDLNRLKEMMHGDVVMDTRNVMDPAMAKEAGLVYKGVGKGNLVTVESEELFSSPVLMGQQAPSDHGPGNQARMLNG